MRRFQKVLFALAAVAMLGWIGASTASAAGVSFLVSASSPRTLRAEGTAEATGNLVLAAQSTGSLKQGSTITLDYGTAVSAASANAFGAVTTTCGGATTTAVGTVSVSAGGSYTTTEPASPAPVTGGSGSGATFTLTRAITVSPTIVAGGTGYTAGDTLTVAGVTGTAPAFTVGVTGGVVTSITAVTVTGPYTNRGANPVAVTGGTGAGATFNLTSTVTSAAVAAGGSGYGLGQLLTVSGGTFTTAAILNVTGLGSTAASTATITKSVVTNTLVLTIATADLPCDAASGQQINISGIRVNANALGSGANVQVALSSISTDPVNNPISVVQFAATIVGTVSTKAATTSSFGPGGDAPTFVSASSGGSGNILLCNPPTTATAANIVKVTFTVTENFNQAFLSKTDENALNSINSTLQGAAGAGDAVKDFQIRLAFAGLPVGVRFGAPTASMATSTLPTTSTGITLAAGVDGGFPFTTTASVRDVNLDISVGSVKSGFTSIGGAGLTTTVTDIETLRVTVSFFVPDITVLTPDGQTGTVKVSLKGSTASTGEAPIFVSNTQASGDALKTIVCATYLLYSWIANVPGILDTGITVSNTTVDPPILGSKAQKGTATMYLFPTDGSASSSVALKNSKGETIINGGETATFIGSSLPKAFTGYGIVVCGFQQGHGIAAFLDVKTGIFGASYEAISLTNPRIGSGAATEFTTH